MNAAVAHIRWLEDCDASSASVVGGKCASLGELISIGMAVPPGFAVTTHAHDAFLTRHAVRERETEVLQAVDYDAVGEVTKASERLRDLVEDLELPEETAAAVRDAYARLSDGDDVPVAVRSSALAEDLVDRELRRPAADVSVGGGRRRRGRARAPLLERVLHSRGVELPPPPGDRRARTRA